MSRCVAKRPVLSPRVPPIADRRACEQGLPVLMVTARLAQQPRNASGEALFVADASAVASYNVQSDPGVQRLDILELRSADATTSDATYSFLQVRTRGGSGDAEALPEQLTAGLNVESSLQLRTVFPERSRWRQAGRQPRSARRPRPYALTRRAARRQMVWQPREGEPAQLGSLALLVEQTTYAVSEDAAAGFARAWGELGYNSLGEPGVVRCDLMQEAARPHVFVARKVFVSAEAKAAHEASEHLAAWRERVALNTDNVVGMRPRQLNTVYPHTSPFPLKSGWHTV